MSIEKILELVELGIQARKLADFIHSDPYQQGYAKALQDIKSLLTDEYHYLSNLETIGDQNG